MESNVHIHLDKKPKKVVIMASYPGFGLVGSIAAEFLIEQLECELIGRIVFQEMPSLIIVQKNKLIDPVRIFYNKKHDLVIVTVNSSQPYGEWYFVHALLMLATELGATEIVSLEGIYDHSGKQQSLFLTSKEGKKLETLGLKPIEQGLVVGVSGLLFSFRDEYPMTSFFAPAASGLPDSKAAASLVDGLSKYLDLKVDSKPLVKQGELFEKNLQSLLEQTIKTQKETEQKKMSYVG